MTLSIEQVNAYKALKRAVKKCESCGLGIGMEDYSLYVGDFTYMTESFESPWHFLRAHNSDDAICLFIENSCITGAGGA